jgi:uncharacterized peroxidase-related enzyme
MPWIETISYVDSHGRLRTLYDRVKGPGGAIDEILQLHALRPHTLDGHMALYKSVLHHTANRLPVSFLEVVGIYVSLLNRCDYCVDHHTEGLRRLLNDDARLSAIRTALDAERPEDAFNPAESAALHYAAKLTREPWSIAAADVQALRAAGLDDGTILEVNQVAAYFAYANRTVLGLGATTENDVLGLSPENSDDSLSWQHG